jgi:hypothetical protein
MHEEQIIPLFLDSGTSTAEYRNDINNSSIKLGTSATNKTWALMNVRI